MSLESVLRDPRKLDVLARGLAKRGMAPPRDLMTAGLRAAAQRVKQAQAPATGGASLGQLMAPRQTQLIPSGVPQMPVAPSTPSPIASIGELMKPRG